MSRKLPEIPSLPTSVHKDVRRAFGMLKGWLDSLRAEGGPVTERAVAAAVEKAVIGETIAPGPPGPLVVAGGFNSILLRWGAARGAAAYRIYRAEVDDLGKAEPIGGTSALLYPDTPPDSSLSKTYWYWVRGVSEGGTEGPYNDVAGTSGSTADEPAYLLELLTGEITESQLYADLNTRIDQIDTPGTGLVDRVANIQEQVDSIAVSDWSETVSYVLDDRVRYQGNLYRAKSDVLVGTLPTDDTYWELIGEYVSLQDQINLNAAGIDDLDVRVTDTEYGLEAQSSKTTQLSSESEDSAEGLLEALLGEDENFDDNRSNKTRIAFAEQTLETHANDIEAEATARTTLATKILGEDQTATTSGLLFDEKKARSDADSAEASARENLAATLRGEIASGDGQAVIDSKGYVQQYAYSKSDADGNLSSLHTTIASEYQTADTQTLGAAKDHADQGDASTLSSSKAYVQNYAYSKTEADSAISSQVSQVSARLDNVDGETGVTVEEKFTAQASDIEGVRGQYTVKIDVNGHVAGFGLASEPNEAGDQTFAFDVVADRFAIAHPTDPAAAPQIPFIVQDGKVYIDTALINNLTATNFVGQKVVADEASVAFTLSASRILAGVIEATGIYIGANQRIHLDGANQRIIVSDGTRTRLILGKIGTDWGIEIYDSSGNLILGSGGVPLSKVSGRGAFAGLDQITAANISTYIASAAIDTAYIKDAAINNAKIGNAAVSTLKIGVDQVTVKEVFEAAASVSMGTSWTYIGQVQVSVPSEAVGQPIVLGWSTFPTTGFFSPPDGYYAEPQRIRLLLNGTVKWTVYKPQGMWAVTPTTAGTYTFRIEGIRDQYQPSFTLSHRVMVADLGKR